MLKKILIANRGEIACRVIKTAKELGLKTVAVYSDADKKALHVKAADEAYYIGASPSKDSYLVTDKILKVAKISGADCIHPGYGFLSENDQFAKQCHDSGIVFIGPLAHSIEAMGSKTRAKEIMASANVPLVPGYYGENQDTQFLASEADKIGYPVLIKAAFGGGGKGMRVVNESSEFLPSLEAAKREAIAGFGNDLVLLERYVNKPRHVEIQVFADNHGNCVYLGDRDCSLQRRHQKVIEEAPAPGLSDKLRKEMGEAAVRCAKAIDYRGAGTVEFLLCENEFFFMEMNTRLQVEHPVTEMVTGVDLVAWQIQVANNHPLPLTQSQIKISGHSFEARIYAEDPSENFIPSSGNLDFLSFPNTSENIRIDTGVTQGDEISPFYDPMIAKLITYGNSRDEALLKVNNALEEVHINGVSANIEFLHHLSGHSELIKGAPDTHFIDSNTEVLTQSKPPSEIIKTIATAAYLQEHLIRKNYCAWNSNPGFRLNKSQHIDVPFICGIQSCEIQQNIVKLVDLDHTIELSEASKCNEIIITLNGKRIFAHYLIINNVINVLYGPYVSTFELQSKHFISEHKQDDAPLAAPLNGTVVKHLLSPGMEVNAGDPVIIIEAMKMEYTLKSPHTGQLMSYYFDEGELVSHGQLLALVEPSE